MDGAEAISDRDSLSWRKAFRAWAELAGVWALPIAWPIYQRLTSGTEALTGLGIRRLDVLIFIAMVSLLVPAVLALIEFAIAFAARRPSLQRVVHAVFLGLLVSLWVWQQLSAWPAMLGVLIPLAVLAVFILGYLRTDLIPNFTLMLTLATPVVIVLFALSFPVKQALKPGEKPVAAQTTDSKTPVVIIVLDELPLASLLNADRQVDPRFFPNMAALQRESTWYRNALSVADNTLSAVPAILSGESPTEGAAFIDQGQVPPDRNAYPDTVCSTAERAGYRLYSQELVTDFCARSNSLGTRLFGLLEQGIPNEVPQLAQETFNLPPEDRVSPFRLFEKGVTEAGKLFAPLPDRGGTRRDEVVKKFTADLPTSDRTMSVLHIALPHLEYQYLPDGQVYSNRDITDLQTAGNTLVPQNKRESGKNLQQMTAQMMYTDKLVGGLIRHMKNTDLWDRSLFLVTADHGVSFTLGSQRRTLDKRNAGWLMPVPLFIKYPGQSSGKVVDAPVNSSDIEPTVLDVIGLERNPRSIGRSLVSDPPERDGSKVTAISSIGAPVELPRARVEREEAQAIRWRNEVFSSGNINAIGGHGDLIGKEVAGRPGLEEIEFEPVTTYDDVIVNDDTAPAYFQATLPGITRDPGPLAISLNGKVAGTSRAWKRGDTWMTGVNLDADAFVEGKNVTKVYAIDGRRQRP